MNSDQKRETRKYLKNVRDILYNQVVDFDIRISDLSFKFTEDYLISNGWVKGNFNGPFMCYEYNKGSKSIVLTDGTVRSVWQSYIVIEDEQDLINFENS